MTKPKKKIIRKIYRDNPPSLAVLKAAFAMSKPLPPPDDDIEDVLMSGFGAARKTKTASKRQSHRRAPK